jgi:hypothetical protein
VASQLLQEGGLDIECLFIVACGKMLDLLYWIIALTRVTTCRLPCPIRPTFPTVAHSALKLDPVTAIVRAFQVNVTSRTCDWLKWARHLRAIMDQHTVGGNAKDVFAVDLEVVDTFFAAKLLDRLDPNVAIEITKRLPTA